MLNKGHGRKVAQTLENNLLPVSGKAVIDVLSASNEYQPISLPFTPTRNGFLSVDINMQASGDWYCYIDIKSRSGNIHTSRHAGTTTYADSFDIQMKKGEVASIADEGGIAHITGSSSTLVGNRNDE